jgi:hypothetical protein
MNSERIDFARSDIRDHRPGFEGPSMNTGYADTTGASRTSAATARIVATGRVERADSFARSGPGTTSAAPLSPGARFSQRVCGLGNL